MILAAALAAVIAITVIVSIILSNRGETVQPTPPPDIIEGEAIKDAGSGSKLTLAYPEITKQNQIKFIEIQNESGEFGFARLEGEPHFTMYYVDESGERQVYYPKIYLDDKTLNYTDFFAVEEGDGFSVATKLDYLCLALQTPYFYQRIPLSDTPAEREKQLRAYGLSEGEYSTVNFEYTENGATESKKMTIKVGEKNVSGSGYYFIVGDRPYVYSSSNNYYDYVTAHYTSFIKPLVVAPGLKEDKDLGPLLTTGYYQWKNELHKTAGELVTADSKVIAYTEILQTALSENPAFIGYERQEDLIEIDLAEYEGNEIYRRLIASLVGAKVGEQTPKLVFTVSAPTERINFGDAESLEYEYTITAVEAILTASGEITTEGVACLDSSNEIKVSYTLKIDGKATSEHIRHAVVNLEDAPLSQHIEQTLRTTPIGELSEPLTFSISYNKSNALSTSGKYVITEIISIHDAEGNKLDKVTESSIVGYRYNVVSNGEVALTDTFVLDLGKVTDPTDIEIKNALIGKGVSKNLDISFSEKTTYSEHFMGFTTYSVSRIDYFVTSEKISAFKFQNSSERDPYYGDTFFKNLMTGGYELYGLNAGVCEKVVKILGGLSEETSSGTAAGLSGDSVVAMGLTPEVMEKYGLYANSIYFELPRSIYSYSSDRPSGNLYDELDDYAYYSTLGFNIYISDIDYATNTRYIASDMYDIVTRVDADDFVFLKYDFPSFWARKNLVMLDINNLESLKIDFNMSDLGGSYFFDLDHKVVSYQPSLNSENYEKFNKITVTVTPSDKTQQNKLIAYMAEKGYPEFLSLTELYEAIYGKDDPEYKDVYPDSLGTSYFKDAMEMMYRMVYVDMHELSDEEKAAAMTGERLLMRMTFEVAGSPYDYVYEFYRADDRRVLVTLHKADLNGNPMTNTVSDFYVSTFAFKKIVTNFEGLLNGEKIDPDVGYAD